MNRMERTFTLAEVREVAFGAYCMGAGKGVPSGPLDSLEARIREEFDHEWASIVTSVARTATDTTSVDPSDGERRAGAGFPAPGSGPATFPTPSSAPSSQPGRWRCNVCGYVGPERHVHRRDLTDPSTTYTDDVPAPKSHDSTGGSDG